MNNESSIKDKETQTLITLKYSMTRLARIVISNLTLIFLLLKRKSAEV